MKSLIIILLNTLFAISIYCKEEQRVLLYKYEIKKDEKNTISENFLLILNGNKSIFTSYNAVLNRKTLEKGISAKSIKLSNFKKSTVKFSIEKEGNTYTHFELVAGAKLCYNGKITASAWNITNEFKEDNGKTLSKATTQYGGRQWVAWFDLSTPIANGPYVFGGLPGLIVEIHDENYIHHFKLEGLLEDTFEEKYYEIETRSSYQQTTYKKFVKYRKEAMENYYEMYNNNSPLKLPEVSADKKKSYNENMKKNFIPIEIAEE